MFGRSWEINFHTIGTPQRALQLDVSEIVVGGRRGRELASKQMGKIQKKLWLRWGLNSGPLACKSIALSIRLRSERY